MKIWRTHPLEDVTFNRAEGCRLFDAGGRECLDLLGGTWCSVLGHGHPELRAAVSEQFSRLAHVGPAFVTDEICRALEKLSEILPPVLSRAVFLNTGSEAIELSLKMARAATGRERVAVVERSYYGATISALSLSEAGHGVSYLPAPAGLVRLPAPDCGCCPAGRTEPCTDGFPCLDGLQRVAGEVRNGGPGIAAVLYEPVLAGAGVLVPPVGYGARLRELTSRCNALLIDDEVTTGLGRTGRWFAFEHEQLVPDIVVLGKAIGGGLPVSVVATTQEVEVCCQGLLTHVQSHQNDPFSARIAATVISILQREGLVEQVARRGGTFRERLRALQQKTPRIREVRGRGLMIGVELTREIATFVEAFAEILATLEDPLPTCARPAPSPNCYDDAVRAAAYARLEFPGTYYLAFRDLPEMIRQNVRGRRALDFGCGAGRSTRLLKRLGLRAVGVDIAEDMIREARAQDSRGDYRLLAAGDLGRLPAGSFDLILSAFTFDNIAERETKLSILGDLARLLASGGVFINLVSSPAIYVHEWASFSTKAFPENRHAKSGDRVRIMITDIADSRPVEDVVCADEDYREMYARAGLDVVQVHEPLGRPHEPEKWVNETRVAPWVIYVTKRCEVQARGGFASLRGISR
jgi:4-aminobutyrate aminotransferase-like enzyme/SAM-dependent methyltransferase